MSFGLLNLAINFNLAFCFYFFSWLVGFGCIDQHLVKIVLIFVINKFTSGTSERLFKTGCMWRENVLEAAIK